MSGSRPSLGRESVSLTAKSQALDRYGRLASRVPPPDQMSGAWDTSQEVRKIRQVEEEET